MAILPYSYLKHVFLPDQLLLRFGAQHAGRIPLDDEVGGGRIADILDGMHLV